MTTLTMRLVKDDFIVTGPTSSRCRPPAGRAVIAVFARGRDLGPLD